MKYELTIHEYDWTMTLMPEYWWNINDEMECEWNICITKPLVSQKKIPLSISITNASVNQVDHPTQNILKLPFGSSR